MGCGCADGVFGEAFVFGGGGEETLHGVLLLWRGGDVDGFAGRSRAGEFSCASVGEVGLDLAGGEVCLFGEGLQLCLWDVGVFLVRFEAFCEETLCLWWDALPSLSRPFLGSLQLRRLPIDVSRRIGVRVWGVSLRCRRPSPCVEGLLFEILR